MLSSTIVSNALPTIIADLEGSQTQYTWVLTASLLATTVSTPIWGKLADLMSKKLLVQLAISLFVVGSALAGLSHNVPFLIGARVLQGLAMGGLMALAQAIIGAAIPPRNRGRYSGYMGAVMAVATVSGPLIGGVIVDTSWLGWRWCFYVCVPLAVISLVILQKYLHLPLIKRKVRIDYLGAILISVAASLPLIWVTFAGQRLRLDVLAVGAVRRWHACCSASSPSWSRPASREPLVPLKVVRQRTTALAIVASLAVGVAMFGSALFLGQYFQVARGYSPTEAGLLTIPMMLGSFFGSVGSGQLITRFGKWKRYLVAGGILLVAGLAVLGTIDHTTPYWYVGVGMLSMGLGMGMTMQNLVLAVQNTVDVSEIGASSATVSFFRSLGGAVGVSVLGAVLAARVKDLIIQGPARRSGWCRGCAEVAGRRLRQHESARRRSPAAAVGGAGAAVVRRCDRPDLPDRGSVCGGQPDRGALHQGGPAPPDGRQGRGRRLGHVSQRHPRAPVAAGRRGCGCG